MKKLLKNMLLLLLNLSASTIVFAQNDSIEMATTMRSNGKIYIVVAVCLTILFGLFFYVWRIDKRIAKFEKNN
jgi:predicted membrane protein